MDLRPDLIENEIVLATPTGNWFSSVSERRPVFDEVTDIVDKELIVETPGEIRLAAREKALKIASPNGEHEGTSSLRSLDSGTNIETPQVLEYRNSSHLLVRPHVQIIIPQRQTVSESKGHYRCPSPAS